MILAHGHPQTPTTTDVLTMAERADRYALYERAVQCPQAEVDFIEKTFRARRGRRARSLAEDFCGSAAVCCEWVQRDSSNLAVGIDNDPAVLAWARERKLTGLTPEQRARLQLIEANVLEHDLGSSAANGGGRVDRVDLVDLVLAMNFSWWLITDRHALRRYFEQVRKRLQADGLFVLDAYGGYDAFRVITEEREIDDGDAPFTYVWDQSDYDPISGLMECAIHFAFPDGSRLDRAFGYRWRLWTLPELHELLLEAGFDNVQFYWQGWTEDDEPDGVFEPVQRADADAGWICYVSAEP